MCVIILRLLLIFIRDSGDEEGLSAAVTTEADTGAGQLTGEAVWPGRPGAPSDSQDPSGHTQSSDISESGRVSALSQSQHKWPFIGFLIYIMMLTPGPRE